MTHALIIVIVPVLIAVATVAGAVWGLNNPDHEPPGGAWW